MSNDYSGKIQVCVGSCSAILSWVSGLSISQDIMPVISGIGVVAGTVVALHGCIVLVARWIKRLKYKNDMDNWY